LKRKFNEPLLISLNNAGKKNADKLLKRSTIYQHLSGTNI